MPHGGRDCVFNKYFVGQIYTINWAACPWSINQIRELSQFTEFPFAALEEFRAHFDNGLMNNTTLNPEGFGFEND